ncbi:type I-C CRISPR-associated protein Cas8c/Csd1 [Methylosinus sp. PW1]|uniref:type I-C CRISPR-associated protein Cas8c/Csd1 n=1 Tax=Methylosinus sp. PW1 TaxID=107636 RepID=UPI0006908D87|nr:type I-C CRISPR-associated protein Cas8c/Csd1 [Methylosinus sp. PW1]
MSMLAALVRRYERMAAKGEAPVPGYSSEKIAYGVTLAADGSVVDAVPLGELVKGKLVPESMIVPQPVKRTVGIAANLLWDKTSYVFGATDPAKESKRAAKKGLRPGAEEFGAFRQRQHEAIGETEDVGLKAFLAFLDGWDPQRYDELPHASDMLDANVVFRLDGDDWLHNRPAARKIVAGSAGAGGAAGLCLVTGQDAPVARLHPSIKGVRGAQSSGAAIVSFNQSAFTSFGKEQGENAPVSEYAAFAYTTALNGLLAERRNRVQIGDATVVFWAEPEGEEEPYDAENVFAEIFGVSAETGAPESAPAPDAETQERDLLQKLAMIAEGRAVPGASVSPATKFYVLGLSPNAARISVRFWLDTTIRQLAQRLTRHFEDLRLEPPPWKTPPSFWRLLVELAAQRKSENIPSHLAGEFARAVLTGGHYPLSLLTLVLCRLRADHDVNGHRAALIKATLSRFNKEVPVSLSRDEPDSAYRLGRLFAVLEVVQRAGVGDVNAGIRDRYVGAASATPSRVFPILLRGAQDHLSAAKKKGKKGWAISLEKEISEIMGGLGAAKPFPPSLDLDGQGRFFVGFYHQQAELFTKRTPEIEAVDDTEE